MKTAVKSAFLKACSNALEGGISHYHSKHASDKSVDLPESGDGEDANSGNHGITEIGIERPVCFGPSPIYTFIAMNDGTVYYKGVQYVEREGEFTGTINDWDFRNLALFIKDSNYMELGDNYSKMIIDAEMVYTMVVMNGKRKTVCNCAQAGPPKLWAIEALIEALIPRVEWDGPQKTAGNAQ